MKKTAIQIYLDPDQDRVLTLLSKSAGKSKAAIVRACIRQFIAGLPLEQDPALRVMNLGESGQTQIADKHDEYLSFFQGD